MAIRSATVDDAAAITAIYNHYITHTIITFEEETVDGPEMARRINAIQQQLPFLVYEQEDNVLGYAYATQWRTRSAYRFAVETTIYLHTDAGGRGIGTHLYDELLNSLRAQNIHCAIGGIALPNAASVALHEKLGFEKVAHFPEVGRKFEQWIDVGYWQILL